MKLRLLALIAAPLLAGGCATTTTAPRPAAAPPVFDKGMVSAFCMASDSSSRL